MQILPRTAILSTLSVVITVLYPLAIWWGEGKFEPRVMAGVLVLALVMRLPTLRAGGVRHGWWIGILVAVLVLIAVLGNALLPLKLYPVVVNGTMLMLFGSTLFRPPSMVERLARLRTPSFPPAAIAYMQRVTQVWCGFFVVNGAVALGTALWASPAVWSLYNGVIAYVLMGALFGGEYVIRMRVKQRTHHEAP